MCGVEAELHGGLVGGLSQVGEEVTNLLLTGVENLAGGGLVDGVGDLLAEVLELAAELVQQIGRRQLGLELQRSLRGKKG